MKYSAPLIKVKPPGPKARAIIRRDERVVSPGNWRYLPLVLKDGEGSFLEDVDGNVFLDFNSGSATQNLGIDSPIVVRALREQLAEFATYQPIPGYFYHELVVELCEKLAEITPGKFEKRVSLGLSGTDATETSIKIARWYTKRKRFISFMGSNHGLGSIGALSVSGFNVLMVRGFSPLMAEVTHIPYPYPYRWGYGDRGEDSGRQVLNYLESQVFQTVVPADEVAGIFVEPIMGDGGVIVPPDGFLEGLQEICRRHGILLIADEVQTGLGRTGKMFAIQHWNVEPDIVILGKPLGGGMPVSACVTRREIMNWPRGAHAITGAGYLLGCAGALAAIRQIEKKRISENAAGVGAYMRERYARMVSEYDIVGDVRGKGLLIGVEMVESKKQKEPGRREVAKANRLAFEKGLLTAYDGLYGNVFRITPPLTMTREEAKMGLDTMEESISTVQKEGVGHEATVW